MKATAKPRPIPVVAKPTPVVVRPPLSRKADQPVPSVHMASIIEAALEVFKIPDEVMRDKGRHPRTVACRAVIVYVARQTTTLSHPQIARAMGRPNHSTTLTAYQRVEVALKMPRWSYDRTVTIDGTARDLADLIDEVRLAVRGAA